LERAKEIKEAWMSLYPEEKRRFAHIKQMLDAQNDLIKHHRSGRLRGGCIFTSAANTQFQGLTADGAKHTGWLIARECYGIDKGPLNGARIVLFLHDEFVLEVPDRSPEHVDRCARRLEELMVQGMGRFVPDVPITCTPAVIRRWYKGPEAVKVYESCME
jgi:DNA polymerase I-like protein with 3'-5' exonuclease and polymerase domains